jgi:hypothetical protein
VLAAGRLLFAMKKGGLANEPALFTGTVIANFSVGERQQSRLEPQLMNS